MPVGDPGTPTVSSQASAPAEAREAVEALDLKLDANGLVAAVVQDAATHRVLMVGYMDEEALARTLHTSLVTFWSRSRKEYWQKGATSGNTLGFERLEVDCDHDALLIYASPAGPTCHTGATSCFDVGGSFEAVSTDTKMSGPSSIT